LHDALPISAPPWYSIYSHSVPPDPRCGRIETSLRLLIETPPAPPPSLLPARSDSALLPCLNLMAQAELSDSSPAALLAGLMSDQIPASHPHLSCVHPTAAHSIAIENAWLRFQEISQPAAPPDSAASIAPDSLAVR